MAYLNTVLRALAVATFALAASPMAPAAAQSDAEQRRGGQSG